MNKIKILIVEEDIHCRNNINLALKDEKDMTVFGSMPNGKLGLARMQQINPDIVLLSSTLTDISVHDFTTNARKILPNLGIIIIAKAANSQSVVKALEMGAFDIIENCEKDISFLKTKPIKGILLAKIRCYIIELYSQKAKSINPINHTTEFRISPKQSLMHQPDSQVTNKPLINNHTIEVVLIGVSTGGPQALAQLIPCFPTSLPVPIVIVLHIPESFSQALAEDLNSKSQISVIEAAHGMECTPGKAFLAPGGVHLTFEKGTRGRILFKTIDSPPENGCKPSINILFKSAAANFKNKSLAIILTGMGTDGTKGIIELKKNNVPVIVQDKDSSVVWGMPGSVVRAGLADEIVPLTNMVEWIMNRVM